MKIAWCSSPWLWYAFNMTINLLLQEIQMLINIIAMLNFLPKFITENNLFLGNNDRSQKSSMYCKEFLSFMKFFTMRIRNYTQC